MRLLLALLVLAAPAAAQTVVGVGGSGTSAATKYFPVTVVNASCCVDVNSLTLYTATLPAGQLANTGDVIHMVARGVCANSTDSRTIRMVFGAQTVASVTCTTSSHLTWWIDAYMRKTGSNTQNTIFFNQNATNNVANSTFATTVTDTSSQTITLTAQDTTAGTAGAVTPTDFLVWYISGS